MSLICVLFVYLFMVTRKRETYFHWGHALWIIYKTPVSVRWNRIGHMKCSLRLVTYWLFVSTWNAGKR